MKLCLSQVQRILKYLLCLNLVKRQTKLPSTNKISQMTCTFRNSSTIRIWILIPNNQNIISKTFLKTFSCDLIIIHGCFSSTSILSINIFFLYSILNSIGLFTSILIWHCSNVLWSVGTLRNSNRFWDKLGVNGCIRIADIRTISKVAYSTASNLSSSLIAQNSVMFNH